MEAWERQACAPAAAAGVAAGSTLLVAAAGVVAARHPPAAGHAWRAPAPAVLHPGERSGLIAGAVVHPAPTSSAQSAVACLAFASGCMAACACCFWSSRSWWARRLAASKWLQPPAAHAYWYAPQNTPAGCNSRFGHWACLWRHCLQDFPAGPAAAAERSTGALAAHQPCAPWRALQQLQPCLSLGCMLQHLHMQIAAAAAGARWLPGLQRLGEGAGPLQHPGRSWPCFACTYRTKC